MHGIRVGADAFGDYVDWGAEAGLDALEHPLALSDETVALMAEKGTAFVPTITGFYNLINDGYPLAGIPAGGFFYMMSRRFPVTNENILEPVRKAREAGIKVGVGTDIPFEQEKRYPSCYFIELSLLKKAGYTDEELLVNATRVGAEILGMEGHGVRVDDEQAARPRGPRTSKSNPESPFRVFERWAWALFLQRRHLLPQSDVLQHQVGAAPTHRPNDTDAK